MDNKILLNKVVDILTKIKTKLSEQTDNPSALVASVIGYIDGQVDILNAMAPETSITVKEYSPLLEGGGSTITIPANEQGSSKGTVQLDNEQLNKLIEAMKDKQIVINQPGISTGDGKPWWQQVTYTADQNTVATSKISLSDIPQQAKPVIQFRGADCNA